MDQTHNIGKKYTAAFLMILALLFLAGYFTCFWALNVNMELSVELFYTGIAKAFTSDGFINIKMSCLSISSYLLAGTVLVLLVLFIARRNIGEGFKTRGILYVLCLLVFGTIAIGSAIQSLGELSSLYTDAFKESIFGPQNRAIKFLMIVFASCGVLFCLLSLISCIVCLKTEKIQKNEELSAPVEKTEQVQEEVPVSNKKPKSGFPFKAKTEKEK